MPNKKGGKKFKKGKKQSYNDKKLIYKNPKEDQEYGKVISTCGNGRFQIECFDGKSRLGILAGNMRKRVWVNNDDIVLISRWEFLTDSDKCSIVHKYDSDEVSKLQKENEFPKNIKFESENNFDISDDMISFDYDEPKSSSSESSGEEEEEEEINLDDI